MDSRDLIIIAVVGVGAWWLWKRLQEVPQSATNTDPLGASSMVAGAAAQTLSGNPTFRGLFASTGSPTLTLGTPGRGGAIFSRSAATLLATNVTPPSVANTPFVLSSPSAGVAPTPGFQPPEQQLSPVVNPASGLRGVY